MTHSWALITILKLFFFRNDCTRSGPNLTMFPVSEGSLKWLANIPSSLSDSVGSDHKMSRTTCDYSSWTSCITSSGLLIFSISSRVPREAPMPPCKQIILSSIIVARGSQSNKRLILENTDFSSSGSSSSFYAHSSLNPKFTFIWLSSWFPRIKWIC